MEARLLKGYFETMAYWKELLHRHSATTKEDEEEIQNQQWGGALLLR